MSDLKPLVGITFPPQTGGDFRAVADALSEVLHGVVTVSERLGGDRTLRFNCIPEAGDGLFWIPLDPPPAGAKAGWDEWVRDLRRVASEIGSWRRDFAGLTERVRVWSRELDPSAEVGELTEGSLYEVFDTPLIRRASYIMSGVDVAVRGREMDVLPVAREMIGGGRLAKLAGGDGPFDLVHSPGDAADEWRWQNDHPPYDVRPLDERQFLDLARACLYLGEYALQPA